VTDRPRHPRYKPDVPGVQEPDVRIQAFPVVTSPPSRRSRFSSVPHDTRDTIVDFVRVWSDKIEIAAERFVVPPPPKRARFD